VRPFSEGERALLWLENSRTAPRVGGCYGEEPIGADYVFRKARHAGQGRYRGKGKKKLSRGHYPSPPGGESVLGPFTLTVKNKTGQRSSSQKKALAGHQEKKKKKKKKPKGGSVTPKEKGGGVTIPMRKKKNSKYPEHCWVEKGGAYCGGREGEAASLHSEEKRECRLHGHS